MSLFIHIVIALSSVVYAGFVFFAPSNVRLKISNGLIALTVMSGTYLVVSTRAHILRACAAGLMYVCVVSVLNAFARSKLAAVRE